MVSGLFFLWGRAAAPLCIERALSARPPRGPFHSLVFAAWKVTLRPNIDCGLSRAEFLFPRRLVEARAEGSYAGCESAAVRAFHDAQGARFGNIRANAPAVRKGHFPDPPLEAKHRQSSIDRRPRHLWTRARQGSANLWSRKGGSETLDHFLHGSLLPGIYLAACHARQCACVSPPVPHVQAYSGRLHSPQISVR